MQTSFETKTQTSTTGKESNYLKGDRDPTTRIVVSYQLDNMAVDAERG